MNSPDDTNNYVDDANILKSSTWEYKSWNPRIKNYLFTNKTSLNSNIKLQLNTVGIPEQLMYE